MYFARVSGDQAKNVIAFPRPAGEEAPASPAIGPTPVEVVEKPKKKRAPRAVRRARRLIAIGGGKGGIGKSLVSANLGIALARKGAKVVMVDADLGGANLHTCLGVPQPKSSLSDFVNNRVESLEQVVVETNTPGLKLISGAQDMLDAANPKHAQKSKLLRNVQALDVDYVLLDLGAGTSFNVLDFFVAADVGVVVVLPEPTSIENAYRFIKAAFFRRLQSLTDATTAQQVALVLSGKDEKIRTPWDLLEQLRLTDGEAAGRLQSALSGFKPQLVVNQARSRADFDLGPQVAAAWTKFFGLELGYLGPVGFDDSVWSAVRARRALLEVAPESNASKALLRIAENLLALNQ